MIRARENNKIVYYFYWRRDTFAVFYVGLLKRALTTVLMSVYTGGGGANATYIFVGVDQPEARSGSTIALFAVEA